MVSKGGKRADDDVPEGGTYARDRVAQWDENILSEGATHTD